LKLSPHGHQQQSSRGRASQDKTQQEEEKQTTKTCDDKLFRQLTISVFGFWFFFSSKSNTYIFYNLKTQANQANRSDDKERQQGQQKN